MSASDYDDDDDNDDTKRSVELTLESDCVEFNETIASLSAKSAPLGKAVKLLLPHELCQLEWGNLVNVTHTGASSISLLARCGSVAPGRSLVYRPMGDAEVQFLYNNGILPDTQPYQAIVRNHAGRLYATKFVDGVKQVDTHPSSVVEFNMPTELIDELFAIQHKAEDGALSHGLGHAAGRTVERFNAALKSGKGSYRVVKVKRKRLK